MLLNKKLFWTAVCFAACASMGVSTASAGVALDGYCPVCLVKGGELVKGDSTIWSNFDGEKYYFPSIKQKQVFDANPTAFVPALRGDCTVCKIEKGKQVAGKVDVNLVHNGRLYLFPGEKQKQMFQRDPAKYVDADLALGGNCPVSVVTKSTLVSGESGFASIYDGQRYLMANAKAKRMFDANPVGFVPAMSGKCTVCKVEKNKDMPGLAEFFTVYKDRLYLFPGAKQRNMFGKNPTKYANVDVALDGMCAVCKIDKGKNVKGKAEFAIDFDGKRYLFPGQKQLDKFVAQPRKYAID